jgi:hypothetical protein
VRRAVHRKLGFRCVIDRIDVPARSRCTGQVRRNVNGMANSRTWALPLTTRFVVFDDDAVVLAVRGPARPPADDPKATTFLRSWIWVEAAMEFTR